MTRTRSRLLELVVLLVVVAAAAGARVGYLLTYADQATSAGPFQVQGGSREVALVGESGEPASTPDLAVLAGNLREHHEFNGVAPFSRGEERTAHAAPAYPYLLAEAGRLIPLLQPDQDEAGLRDQYLRWLQCGLGALTAGLYFLFARWAFGSWLVALLAGGFCALHPFWIVSTAELNDGVLASFLLAAALYLGVRAGQQAEPLTSFLYGIGLAALALTRAALLPFALVALLWFLWRCRSLEQGWLAGALAFLGLVIGLTPWSLRNYQSFEDAVPVVSTTWYHLWMGNNPRATGGPMNEENLLTTLAEVRGQDASVVARELAGLPQPARYRELAWPVVEEISSDGPAWARRRVWAGLYFFFGEDWFTQQRLQRPSAGSFAEDDLGRLSFYPGLLVGSLFGMLILAALGWRWTFAWRREAMPSSLAVFWIPLPYILGHADALSGPRLPLDGVLLTYAAFALACLVPGVGGSLLAGARSDQETTGV